MNLEKIFRHFCDSLHDRKELMTEDNVRYYWFASMLKEDPELEHCTMEYPYEPSVFADIPRRTKKELDFLYLNEGESYCMEIKFHRNPDPNSTYAHTDAAGCLFSDIIRLSLFKPGKSYKLQQKECILPTQTRRFFLYVTDAEMHNYLGYSGQYNSNQDYRTVLKEFYAMPIDGQYRTLSYRQVPRTFEECALDALDRDKYNLYSIPPIRLMFADAFSSMQSESFKGHQCHVRLYEING